MNELRGAVNANEDRYACTVTGDKGICRCTQVYPLCEDQALSVQAALAEAFGSPAQARPGGRGKRWWPSEEVAAA